jgi:hypothetical protein
LNKPVDLKDSCNNEKIDQSQYKKIEKMTSEPKIKFFADNSKKFHSATTIADSDSCCYPFEQIPDSSSHEKQEK